MPKERKRSRVRSKIDELPPEIRLVVDGMLADVRYTYQEIAEYLCGEGYEISRGSVFRYAQRSANATARLIEAQEQTRALVEVIKKNPDADYTEGALQLISSSLTQKLAAAQEDFDGLPLDKACNILISLSKTKSYKDKVYTEVNGKVSAALAEFKQQVFAEIEGSDPALAARLAEFAERAAAAAEADMK